MDKNWEYLIWKKLDNSASEEELRQIQLLAKGNTTFRSALEEREILHKNLKEFPADQPSMRFVKNILEKLPQLAKKWSKEPLVSKKTLTRFAWVFSTLVVFILGGSTYMALTQPMESELGTTLVAQFTNFLEVIPNDVFLIIAAIGSGTLFLLWLDRKLKSYFKLKTNE